MFFHIVSRSASIILTSHPVFIKTRRFDQSTDISLYFSLCITFKKGYIPNKEYTAEPKFYSTKIRSSFPTFMLALYNSSVFNVY